MPKIKRGIFSKKNNLTIENGDFRTFIAKIMKITFVIVVVMIVTLP